MSKTVKEQLDSVFDPQSIAFVGASNDIRKWGGGDYEAHGGRGLSRRIYPVNPGQKTVQGMRAYPAFSTFWRG